MNPAGNLLTLMKPQASFLPSERRGLSAALAPPGDPLALDTEQLVQPQLGKGSSQAPRLNVTFHCIQLLDLDGKMRQGAAGLW